MVRFSWVRDRLGHCVVPRGIGLKLVLFIALATALPAAPELVPDCITGAAKLSRQDALTRSRSERRKRPLGPRVERDALALSVVAHTEAPAPPAVEERSWRLGVYSALGTDAFALAVRTELPLADNYAVAGYVSVQAASDNERLVLEQNELGDFAVRGIAFGLAPGGCLPWGWFSTCAEFGLAAEWSRARSSGPLIFDGDNPRDALGLRLEPRARMLLTPSDTWVPWIGVSGQLRPFAPRFTVRGLGDEFGLSSAAVALEVGIDFYAVSFTDG
ncbi:MAG: hypothetical protein AAFV32_10060 [Myxococcota bacterium]